MAYIFLLITSSSLAFVLGLLQFYMLETLLELPGANTRDALIQNISAVVTLGTVVIYLVSGPLAAACRKRYVMAVAAGCAALLFATGGHLGWQPSPWMYLAAMGILLGVYNAAKMASVPLVAIQIGRSTTIVNGGMSVVFLLGLLPGFPTGTWLHTHLPHHGHLVAAGVLAFSALMALGCHCVCETPKPFLAEQRRIARDTLGLLQRHWQWLLGGPLVWGVASAAQLAAAAMLVRRGIVSQQAAAFIPLFAAGGAIAGTALSPLFLRRRYVAATLAIICMACVLPLVPRFAVAFPVVAGMVVLMGVLFGVATNLIDSALLERVGAEGKEGTGAALQSAMLALMMVSASGSVGLCIARRWIAPDTQFLILGGFGLATACIALSIALRAGELVPLLLRVCSVGVRMLLSLRYRIDVRGLEHIQALPNAIFLPNHPAEIDPVLLEALLWRRWQPRPAVIEDFYHMPVLHRLLAAMRALPIPNMELGRSTFKVRRIAHSVEAIAGGVQHGDSFLLYPSGALQRSGETHIGGASALHAVLQRLPDAPLVLVRTRGLWGSSFSWYFRNRRPHLLWCLAHGAGVLLGNLLLFTPRRRVSIELVPAPPEFPRTAERAELNAWLDAWYNAPGEEPVTLVRYARWSRRLPRATGIPPLAAPDVADVPDEIRAAVREEFARMRRCQPGDITPAQSLRTDLGLDSLEMAEVLVWLDARFGVADAAIVDLTTVGAVMQLAAGQALHAPQPAAARVPPAWFNAAARPPARAPDGATITACFLAACDRMGTAAACADDTAGVRTYRDIKLGALALASVCASLPGAHVGVMLPASVAADVVVLALLLAGKTPVMINWTLGARNVRHVVAISGIECILTSLRFADNVDTIPFDEIEHLLVFLEDIRRTRITWRVKLGALLASRRSASALLRRVPPAAAHDPAIILFTSGSESVPKGVPLTHDNILSNIRAVLSEVPFKPDDVLFSFLPPFHSFGLTTTMLLPLLSGMRVAHYPNPNEARRLAFGIAQWRATLIAGTPTFVKGICRAARPGQLDSLALVVTGAERLPPDVVSAVRARAPHAVVREGYGITECAPVVCLCRPQEEPEGVGRPLPGVELLIVDLERHAPVPDGTQGLILTRGPNVFHGYLGPDPPNPFTRVNNADWYVTGDLGYLTPRGALVIAGRLKRFVKAGGEMVSLPAIEDALSQRWPPGDDAPVLAVAARERDDARPLICLFTAAPIALDDANSALRAAGFSALVRIDRVERINAIPVLGTGKVDYQALAQALNTMD